MTPWRTPRRQFILALGFSTAISLFLFAGDAWRNHSFQAAYLPPDLFLAWIPLLLTVWLVRVLRRKLWSSWEALLISVLWVLFLPNSFYMISDFVHLQDIVSVDILYEAVMFTSFIYVAVLLGFTSLYLVHLELRQRMSERLAATYIGLTLLFSSFAIYVGRDLRWNSWDVATNPGGLLFDLSNRLLHPSSYPDVLITVAAFFVLLVSMYGLLWRGAGLLKQTD